MTQSAGLRGLPEPGTLDVLFVAYGGGHIQAIVPVAQRMQAQGYTISVFAVTTAIAVAEASGLPHFSYSDLPQASDADVQREGARNGWRYVCTCAPPQCRVAWRPCVDRFWSWCSR